MKIAKHLLMIALAALCIVGCKKEEPQETQKPGTETPGDSNKDPEDDDQNDNKNEDTPGKKVFSISLKAESEFYEVEFPAEAEGGETVTVTVTPVKDVFVDEVRYNGLKATPVEGEENTFEFEMPKRKVTLTVNTSSTVTVVESTYYASEVSTTIAEAGETVTVAFGVYNPNDAITKALVNGTIRCDLVGTDIGVYIYEFTMPEGPAVVEGFLESEYFIIERQWDDHSVISMLDCINNQGTADEFCSQQQEGLVHFLYKYDLGYDAICTVTGLLSGEDYTDQVFWSLAEDNNLYQDCWAFYMPAEPVLIKSISIERSTYEGEPFVGNYKGYWVTLGESKLLSSSQPTLNLDLRKSTAYFVTSTDQNAYDFAGIYSVTNGQIAADHNAEREGDYALRGQVLENGYAFAIIDDLLVDNVDNRRFYFTGKDDFNFVCAADYSGNRYLLEANKGGQKSWYFVERDNQSIKKATVQFRNGSSLEETCEAMVTVEGGIAFNQTETFKYTYQNGGTPEFTYFDKKAGTYTSAKGETLVLDGFGDGTYNGTDGKYTLADGVVTFTDNSGKETKMITDANTMTFNVIVEASEDTLKALAAEYMTTTAKVSHNGTVTENGTLYLAIDRNYYGEPYKGYAQYKFTFVAGGDEIEIIGGTKKYVIDEVEHTLTLPQIVQGDGVTPNTTVRKDLVFKISDDYKTLTLINNVYSSKPSDFCFAGAALNAVEE